MKKPLNPLLMFGTAVLAGGAMFALVGITTAL
jgi:hypothetical protein